MAEGAEESEKVQRSLQVCFGLWPKGQKKAKRFKEHYKYVMDFDPENPDKPQIRTSDEQLDYVLVDFYAKIGFKVMRVII